MRELTTKARFPEGMKAIPVGCFPTGVALPTTTFVALSITDTVSEPVLVT
jgi:hypothetical protein